MTVHQKSSGGRPGARRLLAGIAVVLVCLPPGVPPGATAAADQPPLVSVSEAGGTYSVAARFQVRQPAAIALAVLTDYEQIPRFMPDVKTSIVRERFDGGALVEQEAVARMMMFSRRIHLLLEVHAGGRAVEFRDSSGRSFARYEGAWRLSENEDHTVITYQLDARPSFAVPEFLLTRLLKRDASRMIERLRTEIAARAR